MFDNIINLSYPKYRGSLSYPKNCCILVSVTQSIDAVSVSVTQRIDVDIKKIKIIKIIKIIKT